MDNLQTDIPALLEEDPCTSAAGSLYNGDMDPEIFSFNSADPGSAVSDCAEGDSFSMQVDPEMAGERIDRVLAARIPGQSRSYLKKLIKDGCVKLDGKVPKPSTVAAGGETVSVFLPLRMLPDILPEDIPLDILYEDDDVLVVNKPKDMVVHPAAGHYTGTLVNAVLFHCRGSLSGINGVLRPGIVHRIDKDTTGCIVACKNDNAHIPSCADTGRLSLAISGRTASQSPSRSDATLPTGKRWRCARTESRLSPMSVSSSVLETTPMWSAVWRPDEPTRSACIWPGAGIRS